MCGCHINAGPEIGVASTKVHICLLAHEHSNEIKLLYSVISYRDSLGAFPKKSKV